MKSKRIQPAIAAALLLGLGSSILVGAPAFADGAPETAPPAAEATSDPTPPDIAVPVESSPVDSVPSVVAPSPVPAPIEPIEPVAPVAAPVTVEVPLVTPTVTPEPASTQAPAIRYAPKAASALNRPAEGAVGWTFCWADYMPPEVDKSTVDPYDMRTWPRLVRASSTDPWIPVAYNDPRVPTGAGPPGPVDGIQWQYESWGCAPITPGLTWSASALNESGQGQSAVSNSPAFPQPNWSPVYHFTPDSGMVTTEALPGESVKSTTTFTFSAPKLVSIIGLDGQPTTDFFQGVNRWRLNAPTVNASTDLSGWHVPQDVTTSCDPGYDATLQPGDSITFSCVTTATIPEVTFDEWALAVFDQFGNGARVPLTTEVKYQTLYENGPFTGAWTDGNRLQAGFSDFMVSPAQTWLPTAEDKTFRVKAAETLTVTPDGLLIGAQWTQGNIGVLETHITNIPDGGSVTPDGDLEFTSEQVGDYAFSYFLQDPETGLRSQDATGAIQVYSDTITPPAVTPPAVVTPIASSSPTTIPAAIVIHPKALPYTGSDSTIPIYAGLVLLIIGLFARWIGRRKTQISE